MYALGVLYVYAASRYSSHERAPAPVNNEGSPNLARAPNKAKQGQTKVHKRGWTRVSRACPPPPFFSSFSFSLASRAAAAAAILIPRAPADSTRPLPGRGPSSGSSLWPRPSPPLPPPHLSTSNDDDDDDDRDWHDILDRCVSDRFMAHHAEWMVTGGRRRTCAVCHRGATAWMLAALRRRGTLVLAGTCSCFGGCHGPQGRTCMLHIRSVYAPYLFHCLDSSASVSSSRTKGSAQKGAEGGVCSHCHCHSLPNGCSSSSSSSSLSWLTG